MFGGANTTNLLWVTTNDIYFGSHLLVRCRESLGFRPKPKEILPHEYYSCCETGATMRYRQAQARRSISGRSTMAKLRHIAIQVPDLEKAAAFYAGGFDLKPGGQGE